MGVRLYVAALAILAAIALGLMWYGLFVVYPRVALEAINILAGERP